MASSDEAQAGAQQRTSATEGGGQGGSGNQRRRQRNQEVQEVVDELAQETKRVTLLEREEQQLKGKKTVSRLLVAFSIADERKTQNQVEQEFAQWKDKQEDGIEFTGVLLFLGPAAVGFLEGPTDLLFKAVEFLHGLTVEISPAPSAPTAPSDVKIIAAPRDNNQTTAQAVVPRPALIGAIRILYFTELHGVRVSMGWCVFANSTKQGQGGAAQGNTEDGAHEMVFLLYKKILVLCLKVQDSARDESDVQNHYRRHTDMMPTQEEVAQLLGKQVADYFFGFLEFQKVFMKPFQLVLNSELLWPMPPALSY